MAKEMVDPHDGMVAFQDALEQGILNVGRVKPHFDLVKYLDYPEPDEQRLTFARLAEDGRTVTAYVAVIPTGVLHGLMCFGLGYAVPVALRRQGRAVKIVQDAIAEVARQMKDQKQPKFYMEAVVGVDNVASLRVAEIVLGGEREEIIDEYSGQPAYRWTREIDSMAWASF